MPGAPLLPLSPERIAGEARRALEREQALRTTGRARRRVFWQCVALTLTGVPIYALSWHFTDPDNTNIAIWTGFFLSYALPCLRWLAWHISTSEEFGR